MLEPIADGLWHDQFNLIVPPWLHMRGRMVVARLSDGRLWVWSPIPLDHALCEQIEALGEVAHIVAPNALHHLHFAAAAERFPSARRWITPALASKRPDLAGCERLGDEPPAAWAADFEQHRVAGVPKLDEVVFFHRASKTLVVTDLVFNVLEYRGWFSGLVFRMVGAHRRLAQSRALRLMVRDRAAAAASARRILGWSFERVVMAHGELVEHDARARMSQALRWMLGGAPAIAAARAGSSG
jgi:Domain of unknown function (DUF4336)